MKIFFDSNVWQQIVIPVNYENDPGYRDYLKIQDAIVEQNSGMLIGNHVQHRSLAKEIRRETGTTVFPRWFYFSFVSILYRPSNKAVPDQTIR